MSKMRSKGNQGEDMSAEVIVDVNSKGQRFIVVRRTQPDRYDIIVDSSLKHQNCTAEDVMRALGHYLQESGQ